MFFRCQLVIFLLMFFQELPNFLKVKFWKCFFKWNNYTSWKLTTPKLWLEFSRHGLELTQNYDPQVENVRVTRVLGKHVLERNYVRILFTLKLCTKESNGQIRTVLNECSIKFDQNKLIGIFWIINLVKSVTLLSSWGRLASVFVRT